MDIKRIKGLAKGFSQSLTIVREILEQSYCKFRNNYHSPSSAYFMGERKCAFEGCNALEFRTSGYCLRHKDGNTDEKAPAISNIGSIKPNSIKSFCGVILIIIGAPMLVTGVIWFLDDTYVLSQMAGIIMLLIGMPVFGSGCALVISDRD